MGLVADKLLAIFESIIQWAFDSFIEPFLGLALLKDLVFGKTNEGNLVWGTFHSSDLTNGLGPLFYSMAVLSGFVLVALIAVYGMRIAGSPLNPSRRNESIEFIKDLIFVGLILMNLPTLYDLLFTINSSVVNLFGGSYESNLDSLREEKTGEISGVVGHIFIQLVMLGLSLWANFYYLMRKVTLIILMAMGPLMLAFWLSPRFKTMTGAWFRELVGSIFVQSIHAFVFWTVAVMSATTGGFIETVIVYVIFIPISESVRRLFNMGGEMQGNLSKAGAMMGMAGLAGMYGSMKGALGDKSVMGAIQGAYQGAKGQKGKGGMGESVGETNAGDDLKRTLGASPGGDTGSTPRAEKMLRAGDIVGRMGKATFGMAGAISGSGLGPVGAMAGASGGFAAGGVVGGLTGRAGSAAIQGINSRLSKGLEGAKNFKSNKSRDFDNELANEVADRETASWADQNQESQMNSLRERFPDVSESEIDKKFNDIKAEKRAGFYDDAKTNLQSAKMFGEGKASGGSMVEASSRAMANQWGKENEDAFLADYDKAEPKKDGESVQSFNTRRQSAFNDKKSDMQNKFSAAGEQYVAANATDRQEPISKAGFLQHMDKATPGIIGTGNASSLSTAGLNAISQNFGGDKASGDSMIQASSSAMANQWGKENESFFYASYDKSEPRIAGETDQSYNSRRQGAFAAKKSDVQQKFATAGEKFVTANGGNIQDPISTAGFSQHMNQAAQDFVGNETSSSLASAGSNAINHLQGANMFDGKGKPNAPFLAGGMAHTKTVQMQEAFVAGQSAKGINPVVARQDWHENHKIQAHGENLKMYQGSIEQASNNSFGAFKAGSAAHTVAMGTGQVGAFASSALGITGGYQAIKGGLQIASEASRTAVATNFSLQDESKSGIANVVNAAIPSAKAGWSTATTQLADRQGGAVAAQNDYQDGVGYGTGILFGTAGYQTARKMVTKFTPYSQPLQSAIHSPGEVVQMAQSTTDNNGNVQIAQGAIRQVTTAQESYIEVTTKGGEKQIVSRKGAGHSGMRSGDVVYQDLTMDGEKLAASSSSTYRLDSAGGRTPSSVQINNDPSTLLGNSRVGNRHKSVKSQQAPVYNQAVDSGQFYTHDLAEQGFENVQVIVDKDKQFMTGQKEGVTYRVSKVFSGDSRLQSSESIQIPVEVTNSGVKPKYSGTSRVAVDSSKVTNGSTTQESYPYYSTKSTQGLIDNLDELLPSKHSERANRSVDQRRALDSVRRKQGLLG